jgi:hypothetical protein
MKSGISLSHPKSLALLLLLSASMPSRAVAYSVTSGGWVPVRQDVSVFPECGADSAGAGQTRDVAVIEITNNLPRFDLVLDFSGRLGGDDPVEEVRLQGLEGILGNGLETPSGAVMRPGGRPGRFVWSPGVQSTATVGYKIRVTVTYKRPVSDQPLLAVGMPFTY